MSLSISIFVWYFSSEICKGRNNMGFCGTFNLCFIFYACLFLKHCMSYKFYSQQIFPDQLADSSWLLVDPWQTKCSSKNIFPVDIVLVRGRHLVWTQRPAVFIYPLLLLFSTIDVTVGLCGIFPCPLPLWLDGWVKSDSEKRSNLSKCENCSTLMNRKKCQACGVQRRTDDGVCVNTQCSHCKQFKKYAYSILILLTVPNQAFTAGDSKLLNSRVYMYII